MRLKSVAQIMRLIENPVSDDAREDIETHNRCFQYFCDLERSVEFVNHLNTWQARLNPKTGHWLTGIADQHLPGRNFAPFEQRNCP
jgi:hypothetical protein